MEAGGREDEGDGWAGVLRGEGGRERMARGAERGTERVAGGSVADKEDERVGRGGGWATLLLSCLLLGLEEKNPSYLCTIDRLSKNKTKLATIFLNLATLHW